MANTTDNTCEFLESLQRFDLSMLLRHCLASVEQLETALDWFSDLEDEAIIVRAPNPIAEALRSLSQQDRKRIAEAILSAQQASRQHEDIRVETLDAPNSTGAAALLSELLIHRAMMIDVATGGARIQDVDDYYRAREVRIRQAIPEGVTYDNPHVDLWAWYRHWSAELPQYKDRRFYVRQLFGAAIDAIAKRSSLPSEPREATGWERVDRALSKARAQHETASAEEDWQAIGLLCREVIISLAQAVYDPTLHESLDGVRPSETDANRMLEAYIAHVFPGASNKEVRAHHRASLALALNLQHRRTATRQLAALCVEATASTTAVVSIIARASPDQ
ncbi:hypothetical protein L288_13770 [Sphingobium quisquiliarum P25]|uniref:Uncharacterized protein n=1 Tax=Sphingobium quisquiliarum P25 TaxID=1329909 RepID=T0HYQ8_9SPHN|nr:hypothetical protein [Sphingobium quisquiliarum]EQB04500.1 hypothetical protein L288_13770 [Sphingobium quisquiliarum P25]